MTEKRARDNASSVYLVTGGTRGIGFGLARELIRRGQRVFICGRSQVAVEDAVVKLREFAANGTQQLGGCPCDISILSDVEELWDQAVAKFGRVDVFVNNAGVSPHRSLLEIDAELLTATIDTNIKGAMHCAKVALSRMARQNPPGGRIYLTEGLGSDGSVRSAASSIYGMTKYAGTYLGNFIAAELKAEPLKSSKVALGRPPPGMVTTDLLLGSCPQHSPTEVARFRKIMNILADKEETVTPWLAKRLVAGDLTIRWLTGWTVMGRFVKSLCVKRDLFGED
eukprot:TRINITY_DN2557_c1_g1_i3.p1 TRINITY_DN2557_c1_g1~~TRINITY_DN2557_c1_g1_i3.p1  ORF type:complete len:282 (+),score=32.00 TRINITY_DN2557_c1_g1_i3:57-902(+)